MADTYIGTTSVGGIVKKYIIRNGVAGNLSDSGNFYPLSSYELAHDVYGIVKNAAGQVTSYKIGNADAIQYAAAQALKAQQAAAAAKAAAAKAAANAKQVIDPQKTAGYAFKYTMSHADQNNYINAKKKNASLTEYEWRKANGKDVSLTSGQYVVPKYTTGSGNNSGTGTAKVVSKTTPVSKPVTTTAKKTTTGVSNALTGAQKIAAQSKTPTSNTPVVRDSSGNAVRSKSTATQGVSNALTGAQKIAAQSKINAANNTPKVIAKPVVTTPIITKTTLLQAAGAQMQSALSGYAAKVTAPVTTQQKAAITSILKNTAPVTTTKTSPLSQRFNVVQGVQKATGILGNKLTSVSTGISKGISGLSDRSGFGLISVASASPETSTTKSSSKDLTAIAQKSLIGAVSSIFPSVGIAASAGNYLTGKVGNYLASAQKTQTQLPASGNYQDINGWKLMSKDYQDNIISDNESAAKVGNALSSVGVSKNKANQATTAVYNSIMGASNKLTSADAKVSKYTKLLPDADTVENALKTIHIEKGIAATPFASLAVASKVYDVIGNQISKSSSLKSSTAGTFALSSINTQKSIAGALKEGSQEFIKEEYTGLREKPVSKALEYGSYYAGGEVFGILGEGTKAATASKFLKASEKTVEVAAKVESTVNNPLVKKGVSLLGRGTSYVLKDGRLIDIGMTGMLAVDTVEKVGSGYSTGGGKGAVKAALEMEKELVAGAKGYERGKLAVEKRSVFLTIPTSKTITLQEIPQGASATVRDIEVGKTLAVGSRPVISYTKKGGLTLGIPEVDTSLIAGARVHPYSKLDTRVLDAHIKKNFSPEDQTYWFGGREIATKTFNLKKPIETPESFEIYSKQISSEMKPTVKDTITEYSKNGDTEIQVYGSNALRMQMGRYLSGTPKDLEVHVDSVAKFTEVLRKKAAKNGFVEGKDFQITVEGKPVQTIQDGSHPKVEFLINGEYQKGIEVFDKQSTPVESLTGYKPEENLPFGFKQKKSMVVEDVPIMQMQEQTVRNYRGGTTLKDGVIEPEHEGRIKDIRRLIEIGVGSENTFGLGTKQTLVDYTKTTTAKYPTVADSPVAEFIGSKSRVPTKSEAYVLNSNALQETKKNVILKALERKASNELVRSPVKTIRSGSELTIGETETSFAAKAQKGIADMIASESAQLGRMENGKIIEKPKLKTEYTKHMEEEILKTKEVEVDRDLIFDSTGQSRSKGGIEEISKSLSKGLSASSKGLSAAMPQVSTLNAMIKGNKATEESKPKATGDKSSKSIVAETNKDASKPVIKSSKPTIKPTSSKPVVQSSKPTTTPSKSISIPSKPTSKPTETPSKPSSKPITPPSKPVSPPTSKPPSKPIVSPPSSSSPVIRPPEESKPVSKPDNTTKPIVGGTKDIVPPLRSDFIEEVGDDGGLPPIGGGNKGWGLMGRNGMVSTTKVANFEEMVGKKKGGMLSAMNLRSPTSQNQDVQLNRRKAPAKKPASTPRIASAPAKKKPAITAKPVGEPMIKTTKKASIPSLK